MVHVWVQRAIGRHPGCVEGTDDVRLALEHQGPSVHVHLDRLSMLLLTPLAPTPPPWTDRAVPRRPPLPFTERPTPPALSTEITADPQDPHRPLLPTDGRPGGDCRTRQEESRRMLG